MEQRNKAIEVIKAIGRKEWKIKESYQQRSKAETMMFGYETIIGKKLAASKTAHQKTEVAVGCKILNIMLHTTKPKSKKIP